MKLGSGSEAWPTLRLCARDMSQDIGRVSHIRPTTPIKTKPTPKSKETK